MYKDKEKLKFHCFTDNKDEWVSSLAELIDVIKCWHKEGYDNIRVYTCDWNSEEGIYDDVDCVMSAGSFPA